MVEAAFAVMLGIIFSVVFFVFLVWISMETVYVVWLWKNKRKRRYHG